MKKSVVKLSSIPLFGSFHFVDESTVWTVREKPRSSIEVKAVSEDGISQTFLDRCLVVRISE